MAILRSVHLEQMELLVIVHREIIIKEMSISLIRLILLPFV